MVLNLHSLVEANIVLHIQVLDCIDNFSKTGNPHDQPGAGDGDPHIDHKTGNPHRCPGSNC
jgi:hypothetical protein